MGVRKFFDVFGRAIVPIKNISPLINGKRIAIDMMLILCKSIKAIHHSIHLTDSSGVPTAGINQLLNLIPKLERAGAKKIIAIFDNPAPNPMKAAECQRRRECAEECKSKAELTPDQLERSRLEHQAWQISDEVITDAMRLLYMFGVECHIAPPGREAEQYAANLANHGEIDVVISDDTDTLMFGAPIVIMSRPTGYIVIELASLLATYEITMTQFRHICIALGTDFAEKTPRVGPATALTRGKNIPLMPNQLRALEYISSPNVGDPIITPGHKDIDALTTWLVDVKDFNRERILRRL
jgi:5'-3' exonuclease